MTNLNHPPVTEVWARLEDQSYKIGVQVAGLLLVVFFFPVPTWPLVLWGTVHLPLWPPRGSIHEVSEHPPDSIQPVAATSREELIRSMKLLRVMSMCRTT